MHSGRNGPRTKPKSWSKLPFLYKPALSVGLVVFNPSHSSSLHKMSESSSNSNAYNNKLPHINVINGDIDQEFVYRDGNLVFSRQTVTPNAHSKSKSKSKSNSTSHGQGTFFSNANADPSAGHGFHPSASGNPPTGTWTSDLPNADPSPGHGFHGPSGSPPTGTANMLPHSTVIHGHINQEIYRDGNLVFRRQTVTPNAHSNSKSKSTSTNHGQGTFANANPGHGNPPTDTGSGRSWTWTSDLPSDLPEYIRQQMESAYGSHSTVFNRVDSKWVNVPAPEPERRRPDWSRRTYTPPSSSSGPDRTPPSGARMDGTSINRGPLEFTSLIPLVGLVGLVGHVVEEMAEAEAGEDAEDDDGLTVEEV
ncbi:hypothetical protein C8F01DRAFT_1251868 [Mycena amicta]|nr:hypothetical protein C8F01DRAFT_1251868 [Mycena amicta]